jgi:SAM-dependent methyltransferase
MYLIFGGHIFFQTLAAALHFDLFTLLRREPGLTRSELAKRLGVAEKPMRILLLGCVSLGLLKKRGDRYRNAWIANRLLVADRPGNIVPVVRWQQYINYRAMARFQDAIRENRNVGLDEFRGTGATLYERLAAVPELERIFQDAMEAISVQSNRVLADGVDFSRFTRLVDVGGGNGANIIRLARRHPGLRARVFDSPSVCEIAKAHIREAGLADRLDAWPGDCFKDPFPPDSDCILFCHFMTIWSEERNKLLLRKAYEALAPGGAAIVFNMMQNNEETGPLSAALGSPYFLTLATGEGMLYMWAEYEQWMREAGFAQVGRLALVRDHGVIVGIKK